MPLGVQDRRIPHQMMRAKSFYNFYCAPRNARLHQRRAGRDGGSWCAKRNDRRQWLQVDLGADALVRRVATQGRQNADQWVTSYYMSYSRDGSKFVLYKKGSVTKVGVCLRKFLVCLFVCLFVQLASALFLTN